MEGLHTPARFAGCLPRLGKNPRIRFIGRRRGNAQPRPHARGRRHQRMADVVPIAYVGKLQAAQRSIALAQRKEIGIGLTWMKSVRERVNYRHAGILGELLELRLLENARHNALYPS